jgi:hypothetical protein
MTTEAENAGKLDAAVSLANSGRALSVVPACLPAR